MDSKEKKLSSYIDSLNEDRQPNEHGSEIESSEMDELFETVRLVRSLKKPSLPGENYVRGLASNVSMQLLKEKDSKRTRKRWFYGIASTAAAIALIFTLNTVGPFSKTNIVYAMERAFKEVKAYHGILEIMEINAEGESTTQSKVEVWADRDGRYYVKGIDGAQKDLITVNDGEKKWQVQPNQKEVELFSAFPDPYSFTLEIGKEIEGVKNAIKTKVVGDDVVAGRSAVIMEVSPQGGNPYKVWVDKETKMPLQKQSSMEYSVQYIVRYANIDFSEEVPKALFTYNVPKGYRENNTNSEQVLNNLEEANNIVGFAPKKLKDISTVFSKRNISVLNNNNIVKIDYSSEDNKKKVSVLQKKSSEKFMPESMAVLGKVNNNIAEVQSPVQSEIGVLQGGGAYLGVTDITSVRWQQDGFEYAVVGNTSIEELTAFIKELSNGIVELSTQHGEYKDKPQVEVPVDLKIEEGEQKNVDSGHSPWKLDPAFVAQVFVSLKISPEGIQGDYPIKYEELKVVQNTGKEAIVEVNGSKTPIKAVYLKRLIRQDNTGIWTVVGYDPINN